MKSYKRADCRLCEGRNLERVLALTPTPPADSFVSKDKLDIPQAEIPLDLYNCSACNHVQLGHVIDGEEVYLNYLYETASTLGLGTHFKECASDIIQKFNPNPSGLVVDIGSNDGCLLGYFQDYGMRVLGIDPMPGIAEKATNNGILTLPEFFTEELALQLREEHGIADVITSNNLVADTDDLTSFIKGIRSMMGPRSIFFFETFYFYLQIQNHVWDFTYHEHYSYFLVKPLVDYFSRLDMELIDIKPNLTKGGSMRCTVQLKGGVQAVDNSVQEHIDEEIGAGFHGPDQNLVFQRYQENIDKGKIDYRELVDDFKGQGKKIVGYGACATATTLMYHYDMHDDFTYLVDDFEAKHGLYSPGTHIPVHPSDHIYQERPDVIVILAWRYHEKIISRHKKFLESGGQFIVPLPDLRTVSR